MTIKHHSKRSRKGRHVLTALIATGVVGLLVATTLLYGAFAPFTGSKSHIVVIPSGATADTVGDLLLADVSVPQRMVFGLMARTTDYYAHQHPGRYDIGSGASTIDVFRHLRNGSQTPVRLTIPPLRTLNDLTDFLGTHFEGSSADFYTALTDSATLDSLGLTTDNVISLFIPNTYEVFWSTSPTALLARMVRESDAFWTSERRACLSEIAPGFTTTDAIVLASIVEQETQYDPERPDVAGMYINRLRADMPLQADPTVKFALGDFALRRITADHLTVDSPFNTYRHRGLPPGPICIPSVASIDAVLHYRHNLYIYMCAKEDFSGSHNFAETFADHQRNAARYRAALDARGIKE